MGNKTVWATLPFVEDPTVCLKPNRFVAEKVLKLHLSKKNPSLREDTLRSHQKLVDRGHVIVEKDLPAEYKEVHGSGEGYFIPGLPYTMRG